MLVAMDKLLVECSTRGLRLILTLTNYWKEFGGMLQYARCGTRAAATLCSSIVTRMCPRQALKVACRTVLQLGLTMHAPRVSHRQRRHC
jgi:hypothetical protein